MAALIWAYLLVFGALTVIGGVVGYVRAKSRASLIAGGISGALLLASGGLVATGRIHAGVVVGLVVSVALAGRFIPAFVKTRKWMPAGLMAALSLVGMVAGALGLLTSW